MLPQSMLLSPLCLMRPKNGTSNYETLFAAINEKNAENKAVTHHGMILITLRAFCETVLRQKRNENSVVSF